MPTLEPWAFGLMKTGSGSVISSSRRTSWPSGVGTPCCAKFFLRLFLVEGDAADLRIGAGEGNAARGENFLDLAVLAEGSVQREKSEIGVRPARRNSRHRRRLRSTS